eukprot:TRINITY_DN4194_c2_g3_i2.p2 TRINITY_DN4194_c2_g3~~TRINITY_DN4194_c2_g3_i2.p2  ORF type:complete len:291 (-),score=84.54 TRINITY_DN4194_c2_g3_i2:852-1724(-)
MSISTPQSKRKADDNYNTPVSKSVNPTTTDMETPESGIKKFTVHMGGPDMKSVIYKPDKKVWLVLQSLCSARCINFEDYVVKSSSSSLASVLDITPETTMEELGILDVYFFPKKGEKTFTINMQNGLKKSVVYQPQKKLQSILDKICSARDESISNFTISLMDGTPLSDVIAEKIPEISIELVTLQQLFENLKVSELKFLPKNLNPPTTSSSVKKTRGHTRVRTYDSPAMTPSTPSSVGGNSKNSNDSPFTIEKKKSFRSTTTSASSTPSGTPSSQELGVRKKSFFPSRI